MAITRSAAAVGRRARKNGQAPAEAAAAGAGADEAAPPLEDLVEFWAGDPSFEPVPPATALWLHGLRSGRASGARNTRHIAWAVKAKGAVDSEMDQAK